MFTNSILEFFISQLQLQKAGKIFEYFFNRAVRAFIFFGHCCSCFRYYRLMQPLACLTVATCLLRCTELGAASPLAIFSPQFPWLTIQVCGESQTVEIFARFDDVPRHSYPPNHNNKELVCIPVARLWTNLAESCSCRLPRRNRKEGVPLMGGPRQFAQQPVTSISPGFGHRRRLCNHFVAVAPLQRNTQRLPRLAEYSRPRNVLDCSEDLGRRERTCAS